MEIYQDREMKIYLASRYGRRKELLGYKHELEKLGYVVTSRWLSGEHNSIDRKFKGRCDDAGFLKLIQRFAKEDLQDLFKADCLIAFIENKYGRGGHHVEFGAILGWNRGIKTSKYCRLHEESPIRIIAIGR